MRVTMWRGEFENRFRGWNGEKRRINNKDSMERGVILRKGSLLFFFFFLFFLQSGWKRRVPKYCKVLFNNVVSCEVVSFFLFFSTVTYYRRFGLLYLLFAFTLRNIDASQRNKILKF